MLLTQLNFQRNPPSSPAIGQSPPSSLRAFTDPRVVVVTNLPSPAKVAAYQQDQFGMCLRSDQQGKYTAANWQCMYIIQAMHMTIQLYERLMNLRRFPYIGGFSITLSGMTLQAELPTLLFCLYCFMLPGPVSRSCAVCHASYRIHSEVMMLHDRC